MGPLLLRVLSLFPDTHPSEFGPFPIAMNVGMHDKEDIVRWSHMHRGVAGAWSIGYGQHRT